MKVREHIPSFFEGIKPVETEINSLEELQGLAFVQQYSSDPAFYQFSMDRHYDLLTDTHLLMAEMDEGKRWWVVAYLTGSIDPLEQLPEWTDK